MAKATTPRRQIVDPVCPRCEDLGWIVKDDGGAGVAERCACRKQEQTSQYLALAGIPERYRACRLNNFDTRNSDLATKQRLEKALKISRSYVDNFFDADGDMRESGLIFVGNPGGGKTHLASAVLAEVVERFRVRGRFVDFTSLLHQLQSTFDSDSTESKRAVLDPVIQTDLLVLDELGAQKSSEWVMNTLYLIINTRYTAGRPTLFTTNYRLGDLTRPGLGALDSSPPPDPWSDRHADGVQRGKAPRIMEYRATGDDFTLLSTRISPQLVSRLHEMTQPVHLDVPDFRLRKKPRHELARRR